MNKMTKDQLLAAVQVKDARVFARLRFGVTALKQIEQQKKATIAALKSFPDDTQFGANVSKKGHVYIYGVTKDEAIELGEVDKLAGEGPATAEQA